jgi:23S rRNA pseudouridine1911/1915/1917 synthase
MPTETAIIDPALAGQRLDRALVSVFPEYSRSRLQRWLSQGMITVNGQVPAQRAPVAGGETVTLTLEAAGDEAPAAQAMRLDIVYEDEDLIVLDKPAGIVVHPAAGNPDGTLLNGLLHHAPELERLPRGGIVHRLDKDTSGVMVVARSERAHKSLTEQLQTRSMSREYDAIIQGLPISGGRVEGDIARHPRDRKRMTVLEGGKPAVTHYRILAHFRDYSRIRVKLETGRTHQIRVHMTHVGFPLLGDPVYGGRLRIPPNSGEALREALRGFRRQALHAYRLQLQHPGDGEQRRFQAPLPEDYRHMLTVLAEDADAALEMDWE